MAYDKVVDSAVLDAGLKQIADAIREKGGTSDNLAFPAAMAEAIAAISAGGGAADHMGYPVVTGEVTFQEDVTSSYALEFAEGNRLRVKTTSGYIPRPFFVLVRSNASSSTNGAIKSISCPAYQAGSVKPNVYAFINAGSDDTSSWSSTYMKLTSLTWGTTADSVSSSAGSDKTFTNVTIPCSSNIKLGAGVTYRYVVGAPWGYPIDKVEVV